jgi:hypothetical protein
MVEQAVKKATEIRRIHIRAS